MDGNKDEALRCVGIAKDAIASGNKKRALKFIEIAKRLNQNLSVDDLLAACETLDSASPSRSNDENLTANGKKNDTSKVNGVSSGERTYTQEHVQLIRQIKRNKDYYAILGVEKSCSVEEIKKAYKKLSLKVHPDKNKAPGSEEAFKKVCMAFKCLSDDNSRREYDQVGLVDGFEYNHQPNVRRRRRTGHDLFEEDFDPNEIFRSFFGQAHVYREYPIYRTRETGTQQRADVGGTGPNLMVLLQILPFLLIFLLAYLPFSEPEYALQRNYTYQFRRMTEKHEVEYFVKSPDFDQKFPVGSPGRADIETSVIRDYKNMLGRYCHVELQRRQWSRNFPTPHCDKLQNFGLAH